jgi:hypothetical protein
MVGSDLQVASRSEVEYVITRLYAAGLELESAKATRVVPFLTRARMSAEVQRIADRIEELRNAAEASSARWT